MKRLFKPFKIPFKIKLPQSWVDKGELPWITTRDMPPVDEEDNGVSKSKQRVKKTLQNTSPK